jgi:hypothetical protein
MMFGFIYRRAVALKDFGERHGISVFIRIGLAVREKTLGMSASNFI